MEQYNDDICSIKKLLESYILGDKTPTNNKPSAAGRVKQSKDSLANYLHVRKFMILMSGAQRYLESHQRCLCRHAKKVFAFA